MRKYDVGNGVKLRFRGEDVIGVIKWMLAPTKILGREMACGIQLDDGYWIIVPERDLEGRHN